jgi:Sensors of blue-light using FAD
MYHVIYLSTATSPLDSQKLDHLLAEAREYNQKAGITGILFYKDFSFLQVIEGEETTVKNLYAKIQQDTRHNAIIQLFAEEIETREFPDWQMAFRDLDKSPDLIPDGFSDLLNRPFTLEDMKSFSIKVRAFLQFFIH